MKTYTIYIFSIVLLFSLGTSSCSRERIEPTPQLNEYESLNEYFDSQKEEEQVFVIEASGTGPIIGKDSTKIWINKDLLMFPDESEVDWPITVRLVELYSPKDMIYYQMPTVSNGNIMETEGEVRIRIFKVDDDGIEQELKLRDDMVYTIEMPSDSIRDNLKVYYGKEMNGIANWTDSYTSVGGNEADLYFDETDDGHIANVGKLGWINCGRDHQGFYSLSFTSEVDNLQNVKIFTFATLYKSVISAYNNLTAEMPLNTDVKVIAMGVNAEGDFYYQYVNTSVSGTGSIPIVLEPISEEDLNNILDNL